MLMQLKDKQSKIASITLSLFIGGWLLLLCQTCLAAIDIDEHNQQITEISNSCHVPEIDVPVNEKEDDNIEHCLGVCDCDDLSVTVNSEKSFDLTEKIKKSPDLYVYVVPQLTLSKRPVSNYRIVTPPERAIPLPLQNYTVLLI